MQYFTDTDECSSSCAETQDMPEPVSTVYGKCDTHQQWWKGTIVNELGTIEWVKIDCPPTRVSSQIPST